MVGIVTPISAEGFRAMVTEVLDELNDMEVEHVFDRLGLPPREVNAFIARTVSSRGFHRLPDEVVARDLVIIGMLLGYKAADWRADARA